MDWQTLGQHDDTKDYVLIFETGDTLMDELERFAEDRNVRAGTILALGAFQEASLAYFAWESKEYEELAVDEQVEVVSLTGNIGREDDDVRLHIHAVLGRRDGSVIAGHLMDAVVRPTLELFIRAYPTTLERAHDAESGLSLIRPSDKTS